MSSALRSGDGVRLEELLRMADFAVWVTAAEEDLPWEKGGFLEANADNRRAATEALLEANPVAVAIGELLDKQVSSEWKGTSSELLEDLSHLASDEVVRSKAWPKAPNSLSRSLKRLAPALRESGIEYSESEEGHEKTKIKTMRMLSPGSVAPDGSQNPGVFDEGSGQDALGADDDFDIFDELDE